MHAYNSYRLFFKQTINGDYYTALLDRFNNILKKKSPFGEEESTLPSRKCTWIHTCTDGQIQRIPLRNVSPSSIFARFNPLRLFLVSKSEEMVRRKEIHHQRAAHHRNRNLFWIGQIILFGRLEKVGESLDQVYRAKKRLCWEIRMNRSKKNVFYYVFLKTYWFALVPF